MYHTTSVPSNKTNVCTVTSITEPHITQRHFDCSVSIVMKDFILYSLLTTATQHNSEQVNTKQKYTTDIKLSLLKSEKCTRL